MLAGDVLVTNAAIETTDMDGAIRLKQVNDSSNAFKAGHEYEIMSFGAGQNTNASKTVVANTFKDVDAIGRAVSGINVGDILKVGQKFTVDADASVAELAHLNALTEGMSFRQSSDTLTKDIEAMQSLVNTARVQAGSQYAAIETPEKINDHACFKSGYGTCAIGCFEDFQEIFLKDHPNSWERYRKQRKRHFWRSSRVIDACVPPHSSDDWICPDLM